MAPGPIATLAEHFRAAKLPTASASLLAYRNGVANNLAAAYAVDAEAIARIWLTQRLRQLKADHDWQFSDNPNLNNADDVILEVFG